MSNTTTAATPNTPKRTRKPNTGPISATDAIAKIGAILERCSERDATRVLAFFTATEGK